LEAAQITFSHSTIASQFTPMTRLTCRLRCVNNKA